MNVSKLPNAALLALWRGDSCDHCTTDLHMVGLLPDGCDVCGAERGSASLLWREIVKRGLQDAIWPKDFRMSGRG